MGTKWGSFAVHLRTLCQPRLLIRTYLSCHVTCSGLGAVRKSRTDGLGRGLHRSRVALFGHLPHCDAVGVSIVHAQPPAPVLLVYSTVGLAILECPVADTLAEDPPGHH